MIRATTPLQKFTFPVDPTTLEIIRITYAQRDKIIFEKEKTDMTFNQNVVTFRLSQEETKLLNSRFPVQIQVRGLFYNGAAVASKVFEVPVGEVLDDEILE